MRVGPLSASAFFGSYAKAAAADVAARAQQDAMVSLASQGKRKAPDSWRSGPSQTKKSRAFKPQSGQRSYQAPSGGYKGKGKGKGKGSGRGDFPAKSKGSHPQ